MSVSRINSGVLLRYVIPFIILSVIIGIIGVIAGLSIIEIILAITIGISPLSLAIGYFLLTGRRLSYRKKLWRIVFILIAFLITYTIEAIIFDATIPGIYFLIILLIFFIIIYIIIPPYYLKNLKDWIRRL